MPPAQVRYRLYPCSRIAQPYARLIRSLQVVVPAWSFWRRYPVAIEVPKMHFSRFLVVLRLVRTEWETR